MRTMLTASLGLAAMALFATDAASAVPASTKSVKIGDENFSVNLKYAAGHQLNEAEASVLNQTLVENIRNNGNSKIKAAKEAAEKTNTTFSIDSPIGGDGEDASKTLRQLIQGYADTYEFGVRTVKNAEPVDPVEREARKMAKETINAKLKTGGVKVKDVDEAAYEEAVTALAASDDIVKEAKRRVSASAKIGESELGITLPPAKASPAPVEEAAA